MQQQKDNNYIEENVYVNDVYWKHFCAYERIWWEQNLKTIVPVLKQEVCLGCHFIWWCGENGDQNLMYRKWNDVVEAAANLNHWMNIDGSPFSLDRKLCRIECILSNLKLKEPIEIETVNCTQQHQAPVNKSLWLVLTIFLVIG